MTFSTLWLGTPITPFDMLGCALIVVMVLLVTQREEKAPGEVASADEHAPSGGVESSAEHAKPVGD